MNPEPETLNPKPQTPNRHPTCPISRATKGYPLGLYRGYSSPKKCERTYPTAEARQASGNFILERIRLGRIILGRAEGLERFWGLELRLWGLEIGVWRFRVYDLEFRVSVLQRFYEVVSLCGPDKGTDAPLPDVLNRRSRRLFGYKASLASGWTTT